MLPRNARQHRFHLESPSEGRFGFEEIAYLLLMGDLPDKAQLAEFKSVLSGLGTLPTNFVRDVVMTRFAQ